MIGMMGLVGLALAHGENSAIAAFPCQDGWAACIQDGVRVDPGPGRDGAGHLVPSDVRVGWFDLEPTPAFTPFVALTAYEVRVPARVPPPPAADLEPRTRPRIALPAADPEPRSTPPDPPAGPATEPAVPRPAMLPPEEPAVSRPEEPAATGRTHGEPDAEAPCGDCAAAPVECADLVALEMDALVGGLGEPVRGCLEASLADSVRQTRKNKISRLLVVDAFTAGDRERWASLIARHLTEIDASDPDLAYRYALHQASRGRGTDAIRWADTALENRHVWTGPTYVSRVSALYKVRAVAAQDLWKAAEARHAAEPSESTQAAVASARDLTKELAREWYGYLHAAGRDAALARDLCLSAAGTAAYCQP